DLPSAQHGDCTAEKSSVVVVHGAREGYENRNARQWYQIGVELRPIEAREQTERHRRCEAKRGKQDVHQPVAEQRVRMVFEVGAQLCQNEVIERWVIEIVRFIGEMER